jgi:hypothetical protein
MRTSTRSLASGEDRIEVFRRAGFDRYDRDGHRRGCGFHFSALRRE